MMNKPKIMNTTRIADPVILDGIDHGLLMLSLKRKLSCEHLIEDHPEGPDVCPVVDLFSLACSGDI
jgi:hypothetical protein